MKYTALIVMLGLLIGLVSWDIMLRIGASESTPDFPSKTAEDIHDYRRFHSQFWALVQDDKEENRQPEHAAAFAAAGYKLVRSIHGSTTNRNLALKESWDTIDLIRVIHGDDGPETTFAYERFFVDCTHNAIPDTDVLLTTLDAAWNTAQVPDRISLVARAGKKDALCMYLVQHVAYCKQYSERAFQAGDLERCEQYHTHVEAMLTLPWIETLFATKENRLAVPEFEALQHSRDNVTARFLILNKQFTDAESLLESMAFRGTDFHSSATKAELMVDLHDAWHAEAPDAETEDALRTWLTELASASEQYAAATKGRTADRWRSSAEAARSQLDALDRGD
mgnify:FL=1